MKQIKRDNETCYAVLDLSKMITLLKRNSASESQNIKDVKYCDDDGIWCQFPESFEIPYEGER